MGEEGCDADRKGAVDDRAQPRRQGPVATLHSAWGEVCDHWLSRSDYPQRPGASFENYPLEFSGMTGDGGYEIRVPVEG